MIKCVFLVFCFILLGDAKKVIAGDCEKNIEGVSMKNASQEIKSTIYSVGKSFCNELKKGGGKPKPLRVTEIRRSPYTQASYIYRCLKKNNCGIYENQDAIAELSKVLPRNVENLSAKIQEQILRKCFVSKHLSDRGVDLGTKELNYSEKELLKSLLEEHQYQVNGRIFKPLVLDKTHGSGPHLHVNFEPYGFNPTTCPLK